MINVIVYAIEGETEKASLCALACFPTLVSFGVKAVKFGMKLTSKGADLVKNLIKIQKVVKKASVAFSKIGRKIGDGISKLGKINRKASDLVDQISDAKLIRASLNGALDDAGEIGRIADDVADLKVGKSLGKVKSRGDGLPLECNLQFFASGSKTSYGKSSGNISELLENRPELTGTNREKLLSMVQDSKLAAFINEVYRPGASVGDGGTADKLIMEFYEGSSRHLPKAKERLVGINRIIDSGKLGLNDLDIAEALRDDLEYAIDLFK